MSIETVRRIYDAFARGDLEAVMNECAADAVITQDPALPWGGRFVGRDGIAEFASKLIGSIDSKVETEQLFQAGDHVVQQGRTKGTVRHNGAAYDIPECHVWTLRDGVVVSAEFYIDSPAMLAALGQ
jgi:ketosteroid isomerase-like protein